MLNSGLLQRYLAGCAGGYVLAFHDITAGKFESLVDGLRPAEAIPLSELVLRSKQGKSTSRLFAITVDDGVGDTVRDLVKKCTVRGWPVTFYLPVQYLEFRNGMIFQWWRNIEPFLPRAILNLPSGRLDLTRPGSVHRLAKEMEALWHGERMECYAMRTMELASYVADQEGVTLDDIKPPAPISWSEVAEISKNDLIRFESHGVTHAAMSALTLQELNHEMAFSRDLIARYTGRPCCHLAYPFGSPRGIGPYAAETARKYYDSAATLTLGTIDSCNFWLLPRIPLYPRNSRLFARLKVLLKCTKTIPFLSRRDTGSPPRQVWRNIAAEKPQSTQSTFPFTTTPGTGAGYGL